MSSGKVIDSKIPPASSRPLTREELAKISSAARQYIIPTVRIDHGDGTIVMRGRVQYSGPHDPTPLSVRCRGFAQAWWVVMCLSDLERCDRINKKLNALNGFPAPVVGEAVKLTQPVSGCAYGIVAQVADDGTLTIFPIPSVPATAVTSAKNATVL